jgi:hypothetical protein
MTRYEFSTKDLYVTITDAYRTKTKQLSIEEAYNLLLGAQKETVIIDGLEISENLRCTRKISVESRNGGYCIEIDGFLFENGLAMPTDLVP